MSLSLYYHTLRHLKPSQVVGRVRFALRRPRPDLSAAPPRRLVAATFPLPPVRQPSLPDEGVFRFLNTARSLTTAEGWNDPRAERLWLYNLHYFDDLNAAGRERRSAWHERLIARWVVENAPGFGVGWEPYPLSLRIVNWIKWACSGFLLPETAVHSLAVQARYLKERLEYHLLGNHLLTNAKALVFAGLFFDGDEAKQWLETGLEILDKELAEQILVDGGHFERSTMYHSIVLGDILDLVAADRVYPSIVPGQLTDRWARVAGDMFKWLAAMCHPDGDISFFNDAAFGIALTPAQLQACASVLGVNADAPPKENFIRLEPTGYVRVRRGPWSLIFDMAPVGPDYIPGHAHADTLSFELSWNAQRVLTNSGTSSYQVGPQRAWERSTAAHNTVEVDAENSSEVWSAFRVGRRACPFAKDLGESNGVLSASASHDGYRRLKGAPVHRMALETRENTFRVSDTILGRGVHRAAGYFHFHPDLRLAENTVGGWKIILPQGVILRIVGHDGLRLEREEGRYAPEFGKVLPRPVLVWRIEKDLPMSAAVEIFEER